MSLVTVKGRLLRWGNSYGLRLSRKDVERLDLQPDKEVEVKVDVSPGRKLRPHEVVSFNLGGDAADRHDELFARSTLEDHLESIRPDRRRQDPDED